MHQNDVLSVNLNALTLPPEESGGGTGAFNGYFNKTDKKTYSDTKIEYKKDSTGVQLRVEYSRDCVSYYTYCEYNGKKDAVCYETLNKFVSNCGDWKEK